MTVLWEITGAAERQRKGLERPQDGLQESKASGRGDVNYFPVEWINGFQYILYSCRQIKVTYPPPISLSCRSRSPSS